jgi:hypothetical protein
VHPNTIGNWRQKIYRLVTSDLTRKQLEAEHTRMPRIIARLGVRAWGSLKSDLKKRLGLCGKKR